MFTTIEKVLDYLAHKDALENLFSIHSLPGDEKRIHALREQLALALLGDLNEHRHVQEPLFTLGDPRLWTRVNLQATPGQATLEILVLLQSAYHTAQPLIQPTA